MLETSAWQSTANETIHLVLRKQTRLLGPTIDIHPYTTNPNKHQLWSAMTRNSHTVAACRTLCLVNGEGENGVACFDDVSCCLLATISPTSTVSVLSRCLFLLLVHLANGRQRAHIESGGRESGSFPRATDLNRDWRSPICTPTAFWRESCRGCWSLKMVNAEGRQTPFFRSYCS